jgi:hypothetical protein
MEGSELADVFSAAGGVQSRHLFCSSLVSLNGVTTIVGRKTGNACFRGSGRFAVSDCRRGLIEERMAIATLEVFRIRYRAFYERFGRDPQPDEPLFFDPAQDQPVAPDPAVIRAQVLRAASSAGVDGRMVLSFMRLDRLTRPLESSTPAAWRHPITPDRDRQPWRPIAPEEPSSK